MPPKITLPLTRLSNGLLILKDVYVYAQLPHANPVTYKCNALVDTGTGNTWIKPKIGNLLTPLDHNNHEIDYGDGAKAPMTKEVKFGFQKGLTANPVYGWVQFHESLLAYDCNLLSADFPADANLIIGTDLLCRFAHANIVFNGTQSQFLEVEDKL